MQFSSSLRKSAQAISAGALLLLLAAGNVPFAAAAEKLTHYTDVPAGAYYEQAASVLLQAGALDSSESQLRPSALAVRAEMAKLLVNLNDETLLYPATASFNDVSRSAWYFPFIEASASAGWMHGDSNCYGNFRPCYARPAGNINRAEAAALLVRAFNLQRTGDAPVFSDNNSNQWYYDAIQTAADHCVLQGDDSSSQARPASFMNRAEMVVMFYRAYEQFTYGTDCGTTTASAHILGITALAGNRLRVTFDTNINATRIADIGRYSLTRDANGAIVTVDSALRIDARTVDLYLNDTLLANASYTVSVHNMSTVSGDVFSDTDHVTWNATTGANILSITLLSPTRIQVKFDATLNSTTAEQVARFALTRSGGTGSISVSSATLLGDNRTVELSLGSSLVTGTTYRLSANDLATAAGVTFSDSETFLFSLATTGHITSVTPLSSFRVRVTFDTALDAQRAEEESRYAFSDSSHAFSIVSATMTNDRTVELLLGEALRSQRSYTVTVTNMLTSQGYSFGSNGSFVFTDSGMQSQTFHAILNGAQETPLVITSASGSGSFSLTQDGLQYDITVRNMTGSVTSAHFHLAQTGIAGPVIFTINFNGNHATGTWTSITPDQRNALFDGNVYVNVHTNAHPDGEIRGQLLMP